MLAVVQRVLKASVVVAHDDVGVGDPEDETGWVVGEIGPGLVALVCAVVGDDRRDAAYVARKIAELRLFPTREAGEGATGAASSGRFDRDVGAIGGSVLVVSQFTLAAATRKGRRPDFARSAPPSVAEPLVEAVVHDLRERGLTVATGQFGARMKVALENDGPVTLLLDSRE